MRWCTYSLAHFLFLWEEENGTSSQASGGIKIPPTAQNVINYDSGFPGFIGSLLGLGSTFLVAAQIPEMEDNCREFVTFLLSLKMPVCRL